MSATVEKGTATANSADETLPNADDPENSSQSPQEKVISRLDPYLVYFKKGDPDDPLQWPLWRKVLIVFIMCLMTLWVTTISAIYSPATNAIAEHFGTSPLVARIPQAAFLVGFSIGPVILTPIAEDYGRKWVLGGCLAISYIFQVPCALAPNYACLLIARLLGGIFSSPIFNACANVPDLFVQGDPKASWALNCWCLSAECFILVAPVGGAYITERQGWPWIFWWSMIVGFALMVPYIILVPETRQGVLLSRKAKRRRKETGDDKWFAEHEVVGRRNLRQIIRETLVRPVFMLCTEPIVFWLAFLDDNYGIYYLAIEAVPIVYAQHGIYDPIVEFIFVTVALGGIIAVGLFYYQMKAQAWYEAKYGNGQVIPEAKLIWMIPAGPAFPVSLFLFGWLSLPQIHWAASAVWLILFGVIGHIIFLGVSDYTVDSYGHLASSAITGQSFARELSSAGLVIVGSTFYENLGPQVATSILGAIAAGLCFVPYVFFRYGATIRERSSYSLLIKEAAKVEAKMRTEEEMLRES